MNNSVTESLITNWIGQKARRVVMVNLFEEKDGLNKEEETALMSRLESTGMEILVLPMSNKELQKLPGHIRNKCVFVHFKGE